MPHNTEFMKYLELENNNLLASLEMVGVEYELFDKLDKVYRRPLINFRAKGSECVVPQLYIFVHSYLYISMSCLLRCHISDSFATARKAIDATLSAYKIILEPQTSEKYLAGDKTFQYIKNVMKTEFKKDPTKHKVLGNLIGFHEECSGLGAHADYISFFYRIEVKDIDDKEGYLHFNYFQFPDNKREFRNYFALILGAFFEMFRVFKLFFFINSFDVKDQEWESDIRSVGKSIVQLLEKVTPDSQGF